MEEPAPDVIERLIEAMNGRDADAVAACVAEDYRSEAPAHPTRSFTGREQVRRNWRVMFENTPDLSARFPAVTVDGDTVWAEWEIDGTQTDGSELEMRGVAIWEVEEDLLRWGRIYLEPVEYGEDQTWAEFYDVGDETGD